MRTLNLLPIHSKKVNQTPDVFYSGINSLFNDLFLENDLFTSPKSFSKTNICEDADSVTLEIAIPGMKKSDFDISISEDILSISTSGKKDEESKQKEYTYKEFTYASLKKEFQIPKNTDLEKINASYNNGVLFIKLPKKEAEKKLTKSIKVN